MIDHREAGVSSSPLPDYARAHADFDLDALMSLMAAAPDGGINACIECCDRHAGSGKTALEWENEAGDRVTLTFE